MLVERENIVMNVSLMWGFLSKESYNVWIIPHDSWERGVIYVDQGAQQ